MGNFRQFGVMALQGLFRNRMQAGLAMLGVTVGVAALVTSLALGRGAQDSLNDQLRAAGANLIEVTAGNYAVKQEIDNDPEGHIGHTELEPQYRQNGAVISAAFYLPSAPPDPFASFVNMGGQVRDGAAGQLIQAHYEDDPMAIHDHPTSFQRLGDASAGLGSAATLTRDDAKAIVKIPGVQYVVAAVHENVRVFVQGTQIQWFTRMHGTEADLPQIRSGWTMAHGRFLNTSEVDKAEQVMVLGRVISDQLFGANTNPVGKTVLLWHQPFEVIGVIGSRSWAAQPAAGDDQFDAVYVPVSTISRLLNLSKLNSISVTTVSVGDTKRVVKAITDLLRQRHHIGAAQADDFHAASVAEQVLGKGLPPDLVRAVTGNLASVNQLTVEHLSNSLSRTNRTMLALLAGVATVSLLVGGIGVMNLLMLSVTQRTREVGLRIALGARRGDIAIQFLFEAVLLCLIGGALGIVFGVAATGGLQRFFHWSATVSPTAAVLAVLAAALLGIVFGVYPARRAAALDPIEALRHE